MTRMDGMSHADCQHCGQQNERPDPAPSSCAGHCLANIAGTEVSNATPSSQKNAPGVVLNTATIIVRVPDNQENSAQDLTGLAQEQRRYMVVLRQ